ncbi:MAG: HD family phosphohydrolase [Elusimicrobiota bacterium]
MRIVVEFLKTTLTGLLEKLNQWEEASPRSKKNSWYRSEFHFPTWVVGLVSSILLYVALFLGGEFNVAQSLVLALFVLIVSVLFSVYLHRDQKTLVDNDDAIALLGVVFLFTLILIEVFAHFPKKVFHLSPYLTPISLAPLIICLLLNQRLAIVLSFVISLIFGIANQFSLSIVMVGAFGGVTMVAAASKAKSANQVAQAGIITGVVQVLIVIFLGIILGWSKKHFIETMGASFLSGIIASVLGLGFLPFLESFFSRISNLRLVELASGNHPLLKKMSLEAPGTYHHSLIMASLAEDAAHAIGANGLLCRVGAYFHDIGKMVKPEYFIENQGALGNPHDQVSPSLSRLVITSHIKEGLAIAKEYNLDPQIIDFIPMHHGTSKIEYFYLKALNLEAQEEDDEREEIKEESYRYPGPRPHSKETAIVMLADSVEAASRTLEEPNHQRYKDLVSKLINRKLADGQLSDTPLTLRDLKIIAERFTSTLSSIHHSRIAYPEAKASKENKNPEDNFPLS